MKDSCKNSHNPRKTSLFEENKIFFLPLRNRSIIYMLHNPDVMKRCQRQIDDAIGRHRAPSMKDKASMPYVEATILEILRMSDVVPFGVSINLLYV